MEPTKVIVRAWTLLLVATAFLSADTPAPAQPLFSHAESIESTALNADVVVLGKFVEFEKTGEHAAVTIAVDETMKGRHQPQRHIRLGFSASLLAKWQEQHPPLLVATWGDEPHQTRVINLADEDLAVLTADFKLLRKAADVVRVAKETLRRRPGVTRINTFSLVVPRELLAGTRWLEYHQTLLTVPVDERPERRAIEYVVSKEYQQRREGAEALRYFKSNANIARVKALLDDAGWAYLRHAEENRGVEVRYFGIREAAHETLEYWGVDVEQPKLREEVSRPEVVRMVVLAEDELTEAALKNLDRFPNLDSLHLGHTQATDAHLKTIAGLTRLKTLYLNGTKVTDAGLKHLLKLKNLQALLLDATQVTDAGMKHVAGLKNLEHLYVSQTPVTDAGLAHLAGLQKLSLLDISRTQVTDEGLELLAGFESLRELYVEGSRVTAAGVAELRRLRVGVKIHE